MSPRKITYSWPNDVHADFEPRDGTTDAGVIDEIWNERVYVERRDQLEGLRVLDLGANIGAFSVLAVACGADLVVAVEPEAANLARLNAHIEMNDAPVTVVPIAAGAEDGHGCVVGEAGSAYIGGLGQGAQIPVIDVAAIVEMYGPFDLVKIDVEGAEWEILPRLIDTGMVGVGSFVAEHHGPLMLPHLAKARTVPFHAQCFGDIAAELAELGSLQILGRPSMGGTLRWQSYNPPERG